MPHAGSKARVRLPGFRNDPIAGCRRSTCSCIRPRSKARRHAAAAAGGPAWPSSAAPAAFRDRARRRERPADRSARCCSTRRGAERVSCRCAAPHTHGRVGRAIAERDFDPGDGGGNRRFMRNRSVPEPCAGLTEQAQRQQQQDRETAHVRMREPVSKQAQTATKTECRPGAGSRARIFGIKARGTVVHRAATARSRLSIVRCHHAPASTTSAGAVVDVVETFVRSMGDASSEGIDGFLHASRSRPIQRASGHLVARTADNAGGLIDEYEALEGQSR